MTTIIPGRPARPIVVEPSGPAAQVRVDSGGRIPPGGATGQALLKASAQDYATEWGTVSATVAWDDVTGKPTFATVAVTGAYGDLTGLPTLFSGAYGDLTGIPGTFAPSAHTHPVAQISDATAAGQAMVTAADAEAQRTLLSVETTAQLNTRDTNNRARANHTGTQLASTISDFATAVAATAAVTANTAKVTNATHTGDVTGATTLTIANDAVTNAKLANMATATIKGRTTSGTGDPEDLTATQATALLDTFTSGARGLVPASGGGTANFLRADGSWVAPAGGGGSALAGDATLTLPSNRFEHQETVTATGVTDASRVSVWLAPGEDADENTSDMVDLITISAAPGTDQITVRAAFSIPTTGPLKIQWSAF